MDGGTEDLALAQLIQWLKQVAGVPRMPGGFAWATVDVDRSIRDLGLFDDDPPWVDAEEPLLGATGRRITFGTSCCVVLEPSTEGLLAGWLARNGEGLAAFYVDGGLHSAPVRRRAMTAVDRVGWLERPDTPTEMFVIRLEH